VSLNLDSVILSDSRIEPKYCMKYVCNTATLRLKEWDGFMFHVVQTKRTVLTGDDSLPSKEQMR
jgi:hypothetical protein